MSEWISAAEAASILGISQVALLYRRRRGVDPEWRDEREPGSKYARPRYRRESVEALADKRQREEDGRGYHVRLTEVEKRLASLEIRLGGKAGAAR